MADITISEIDHLLKDRYGLLGEVKSLDGEVDFNYKIRTTDQTYLLKICKSNVPESEVQFQVALLNHLANKELSFSVPAIVPTLGGADYFMHEFEKSELCVRLHTWVSGHMLADIDPRTDQLFHSWGEVCGELSMSLSGFDHEDAHRFDKWNPKESLYSMRYMDRIEESKKK